MRVFVSLLITFLALLALAVWESYSIAQNGDDAAVVGDFGSPIPGLDADEKDLFELGRSIFVRRFRRTEGLGPHFNATSCVSCHEDPAPGGSSKRYRDFFLVGRLQGESLSKSYPDCDEENRAAHKSELCLPSLVIPHYGPKGTRLDPVAATVEHPLIPADADVVALRNAPPMFGVGLFRLVADEEILSRSDPFDEDGDGISGQANFISAERFAIGRFGYKCQTASIEAFNRGALQNQMGITSDSTGVLVGAVAPSSRFRIGEALFGMKTAYAQIANPIDHIVDYDQAPDPEINRTQLSALVFFQEHLAAPRRGPITASVQLGEQVFGRLGCTSCHVPSLSIPDGLIHPYTDLLLHDMGPELADGVIMERAQGNEFRTQPLWGLCQHAPFLHDGRADTVEDAILLHGGEAEAAREEYKSLSDEDKGYLHRFLQSL